MITMTQNQAGQTKKLNYQEKLLESRKKMEENQ